ncbi:MAG: PAS domain S-box protein [Candidatus Cloacimonas sp.]|jgi:PAS domain S-box-containing protein|nr:PAS domain S-box protein [Candidatus Cloacimonas sp.]
MNSINQTFYRMLFDKSPVSLWVEDFSGVYEYIQELKSKGVEDVRAHFLTYPESLQECVAHLKVVDVNNTTLWLYKAKSKQELYENFSLIFKAEAMDSLLESVAAIADGRRYFDGQGVNYDLHGNKLHFNISWSIPGGEKRDYENVIVAMQDMTKLAAIRTELEEREALFRCIFEQASEGMMLMDSSGKIILANQAMEYHLGTTAKYLVGTYLWDVYSDFNKRVRLEKEPMMTQEGILEILADPLSANRVAEYSFLDDKHKLHAHKQTLLPILTGKEHIYAVILTDLTPVYRSEVVTKILHKISHAVNIEASLEDLFHTIHVSLGRVIDVTNFYIALYDEKSNLVTFPYLVDEMNEESSPVVLDDNTSLTAQIISEAQTLILNHEDVKKRTHDIGFMGYECMNYLGVPLILSGKVIGALVVQSYHKPDLYDVEDKLLLESVSEQIAFALHKKQTDDNMNVLIQAIEQAGEGIVIFSPEGIIQYVNTIFEKITSYRRIELLDKPFEYLPFEPSSRAAMKQSWLRVRSSQPWHGKIDMIRKDGPKITLDMVVKPVIDNDGRLSSIIASCKDVTFEILREEQLKRTQRLEAIGRLTGGIAHDFNNILSAIIGYTELAGDDLDQESDSAMNLVEVLKSATRAKEMISHLISFSRQEESKTEVIELVDHVKESVRFLRSYLPRSIKIKERYAAEKSTVIAVPGQIHQIIINFGTNSMHALHREGAQIEIAVESIAFRSRDMQAFPELDQCQYLKISVSDNGSGIDPSIADHIFDPYFTTKSANEGTGLGLSIVHSIVQAHRGAIRMDSEIGMGTCFTVYLPIFTPDLAHLSAPAIVETVDSAGSECIMFVDDEPSLVNIFRQGMMRLGYKVEGFTDPRKAHEHFSKSSEKVDIVVTDTTMPYMNGVDLAEKLLKIRPDIPIIICTGFTTLISVDDARSKGISDFVMKPFKMRDIAVRIRELLNSKKEAADAPGSIAE